MRWKALLASALLLISVPSVARAQTALRDEPQVADALQKLDMWIEQELAYREVPGLSIAVVYDQEIVWAKGYGYADLEKKIPATPSTVYRIGSITKVFTSTAIMQLRDAGKLRLDDPVSMHLPWFHVRNPFPDEPEITVRELLTHTSGLPRDVPFPSWTDHVFPTQAQLKEAESHLEVLYPPDTTYHYSNYGMAILGQIVAEVSGRPWAEYVDEEILRPLGMTSSSAAPGEELLQRRATGYMRMMSDGTRRVYDYYDTKAVAPAASIVSTVEDLSLFASLQFREGPAGADQILRGSTLREMHRVHWVYDDFSRGRGLGFDVNRREGKTFVGKTGHIGGIGNRLLFVPREKIAVIVSLNADDGTTFSFASQAYKVVGPALLIASKGPAAPKPEADPAWQRYVGLYTDPWGEEYKVLILGGELVMYSYEYPPSENAASGYSKLTPVEGSTFRMPDNELVTFELDDDGKVVRVKRRNDFIFPMEE